MQLLKKIPPEHSIKVKVRKRLRQTSTDEIIRWTDNTHTALGQTISNIRKSLTHKNQALAHIEDLRTGALSLLAAADALEEKLNS